MSRITENELMSQFDTVRKEYIQEEQKLRDHYFVRFQSILKQIFDLRKSKEAR